MTKLGLHVKKLIEGLEIHNIYSVEEIVVPLAVLVDSCSALAWPRPCVFDCGRPALYARLATGM